MRYRRAAFLLLILLIAADFSALLAQRGFDEYALVLQDPPLAAQVPSRKELRRAAADDGLRRIEAAQSQMREELGRRGIHVSGSARILVNAVFVRAPKEKLAELRALPGVSRLEYMPPLRPLLDRAAELINAPAAWNALGGTANAGAGIKIGILDTGIDQNHPGFRDPSLTAPAGFPKCQPQDCAYTNSKVIVARSYVSMLAAGFGDDVAATSRPDDLSPRDRVGHGTAAAMIAAGVRNTGPSATITGIAPKAYLGNYKIFGSPGVNDYTFSSIVIQALDDAFLDGMDIVTLSLGSPAGYGPLDYPCTSSTGQPQPCDLRADAVQNAVNKGMVVVAAAGNDGDIGLQFPTLSTIATPGTAPAAITVGASTNSHVFFARVKLTGGDAPQNLQQIPALFGDGPHPLAALTAPLKDVSKLGADGRACNPLPGGSLASSIALVERGDCSFTLKVNNAQTAGATGVVIYNNVDSNYPPFSPVGLVGTGIPAAIIGRNPGLALKDFLVAHADRPTTMDPALVPQDADYDTVAFFSSHGPAIGTNGIKPELVAVGTDLYTATQTYDPNSGLWDPTGYTPMQGTSFSVPMVAGAAALVMQARPSAQADDVKSAVVNTAMNIIQDDVGLARVTAVGAGILDANAAVRSTVSVDPATLSFGVIAGSLPSTTLRITNTGMQPVNLTLAVEPRDTDANARVVLDRSSLPLAAGATTTVVARLEGTQPGPGSYEGAVTITGGSVALRVPYLYLVGDGIPYNMFVMFGDEFDGTPGGELIGRLIGFKLIDKFGVPVASVPVVFRSTLGGGTIKSADANTDIYGIAAAIPELGPQIGQQQFTATAGGLTVDFNGEAFPSPSIYTNGIVNAASGRIDQGLAPGSYVSIYGQALSPSFLAFDSLPLGYLPLSLTNVSVSFDVPDRGISLPGRLHFVSDGQVNVQVPWELEGLNSVKVKVSIADISSAVYDMPLARNSPGFFEYPLGSGTVAALVSRNGQYSVITTSNPARRGETVELYCNGLGPVNDTPPTGEVTPAGVLRRTRDTVSVTIGGRPATPDFSGLTPYSAGLYQVNVKVPDDAGVGNRPVVMSVNGVTAKTVNLPVQ
ncbi:MAG TPA: S8 family serine peptidase [Bryobacteraceae bacterium]|nr:S8 family serine peptidase [Bryobacteraceae bacterium]